MLDVRQKEVETIETIIYFKDLPDKVERVVDSHDNPCMAINEFAIVYELDILPEDPLTLGIIHIFTMIFQNCKKAFVKPLSNTYT